MPRPRNTYPRKQVAFSILPEAHSNLHNQARSMGISASRLLELIVLAKIPSPFWGSGLPKNEGSTREDRE